MKKSTATSPVKPVEVSDEDMRLMLRWAEQGARAEIERLEVEYVRHLQMSAVRGNAEDLVIHSVGGAYTRAKRIQEIPKWLHRYHAAYVKLRALIKQHDDAKIGRDAHGIAEAVMQNRRDEENARKTVKTQ